MSNNTALSTMEDKENVGNVKEHASGLAFKTTSPGALHCKDGGYESGKSSSMSSSPLSAAAAAAKSTLRSKCSSPKKSPPRSQQKQQTILSPIDSDLLMVSPPPYNHNRKSASSSSAFKSPPTPANSETILSAFRQVESTLNAEIHDVKVLASAGTSKKSRRRCGGKETEEAEGDGRCYGTSPESDVDKSPVPPSFPPMPSPMRSRIGIGIGGGAAVAFRSPTRSSYSPMRAAAATSGSTPMNYSSLSRIPTMAASPLPNKSLLPILSTLEEDQNSEDLSESAEVGGDKPVGVNSLSAGNRANDPEEGAESEPANDEANPDESISAGSESNSKDELFLPVEEIEFPSTNDSPLDATPVLSKQTKPEIDEEDASRASNPESPQQAVELCADAEEETVESEEKAVPPAYRRRIICEDSSESGSDDEEDEASGQSVGGGMEKELDESSESGGEEELPEKSDSDQMKANATALSNLDLNDGIANDKRSVASAGDEKSVQLNSVPLKTHRRRIIDDDEEDDDSTATSGTSDTVSEGGSHATCKSTTESETLDANLGAGFSGLTLNESSDSEEEGDETSFRGDVDDASSARSKEDPSINTGGDADEAESEEDDESVTCFDACGCWALDEAQTGDLYLSDNSDVKWPRIRLPLPLYNKLFQHQRIGVQWMASLHRDEIKGGILADDMGMGKTMQVLSYLGSLMRARTISNAIVICPKSVVRSWEREANLILKNLCVNKATISAITSDMSKEKRKRVFTDAFCSRAKAPHLVITTYGLASNHISDLNKIAGTYEECHWNYVVLDEGHLIKNRKTKTSQDMRILSRSKKTRRILLTGTPIQNNMRELHSLFDWATSSKLLGSIQTFLNKYGDPIEDGRQRNASEWTIKKAAEMNVKLKKTLSPYFLQRLKKTTFEDELPEKKELVVFTQLSSKQRRMYEDFTASVFDGETASPLAAVSWLKMLCGHPSLTKEASRKYKNCDTDLLVKDSSKLQVLLALLTRLKKSGHRSLVFSQSTKMLDIMEKVFDGSISYLRIDGSSAQNARQKYVDHFNDIGSGIDIMLLSTKAAGTGLTLTGADRAIIYDPSWNPAEDAQAVDRCYRIGQTRNVTVYRFIAAGTVEEKMYEKQVHKDGIKRVVLSSDRSTARYFDQAELADLFKLAPMGECPMMEKFNEKSNSNASGASGKPSFLSKHPLVIGVASHDTLYSAASVDVDLTSPKGVEETPFSRSPFEKAKAAKKNSLATQVEDLTGDDPQVGEGIKPLGGHNRTRQIRENAKAERNEENAYKSSPTDMVSNLLSEVDALIVDRKHGNAMGVLLDLVNREMNSVKANEKLAIHEKIAQVALLLGWL